MKNFLKWTFFASLIFLSSVGLAQDRDPQISPESECTTDADCVDGEICEIGDTDVACPPCPEGAACEPCPEPETFGYCVAPPPPPCTSDADCAAGDVCVTF